jgi:hypothetical protein
MLVKTQHNLMPHDEKAHSVVIEDDMGNPIFVATHIADGILYSAVGDNDFKAVLNMVGLDNAPTVKILVPPK